MKKFEAEKNKRDFNVCSAKTLRDMQVFYHKNINKKEAIRLFDDAFDLSKMHTIVTPDLTTWIIIDGVVQEGVLN